MAEEDERAALFDHFVVEQKRKSNSLSLSIRRNTCIDTIIRKECYLCDTLMPPYVHHCSACGYCVVYLDHHCPWVNNCVGYYNQKLFFLFNFYALITLSYSAVVLTRNFLQYVYGPRSLTEDLTGADATAAVTLFTIYLGFLFVLVVFFDQVTIILNRMRMVDRINLESKRVKEHQVPKHGYENYKFSFGGPFGIRWFLPIAPNRDLDVEELYN